jgi:hypothetical protein
LLVVYFYDASYAFNSFTDYVHYSAVLMGIAGNETADQLKRTGSEQPFIGHEPAYGISIGVA